MGGFVVRFEKSKLHALQMLYVLLLIIINIFFVTFENDIRVGVWERPWEIGEMLLRKLNKQREIFFLIIVGIFYSELLFIIVEIVRNDKIHETKDVAWLSMDNR